MTMTRKDIDEPALMALLKQDVKRTYLRDHAPRILVAFISGDPDACNWTGHAWSRLRKLAIIEASLLFDDIEALDLAKCPHPTCRDGFDFTTSPPQTCSVCRGSGKAP